MKKTYKIEVDCPSCANLMEQAVNKTEGVKAAVINFMTQKMVIEFEDGVQSESVMKDVIKKCRKIEDGCEIYE